MSIDGSFPHRSRQRLMLVFALLGEFLMTCDIYGFAATHSFISASLGITAGEVGLLQGSFAVTYCIGLALWSPLSRKVPARLLYVVGLAAIGAGVTVQALFPSVFMIFAARLFIGFFEGAVWLGFMKLIVEWYPPQRRGVVTAMILSACSVAIMVDFAVGIPVAQTYGWPAFFLVLGLVTLCLAVAGAALIRPGPEAPDVSVASQPLAPMFRSRWFYVGGLAIFGDTFALNAGTTWAIPAFVQSQRMSMGYASLLGTLMGLSQVLFLMAGGYLSDRISRPAVIMLGAILGFASALLFIMATATPLPFGVLVAIVLVSGVSLFSGGAIMAMLGDRFPTALAAAAIGYTQFFSFLSDFLAPTSMGFAIDRTGSYGAAFTLFAIVEALVLVVLVALTVGARGSVSSPLPDPALPNIS